MRRRPAAAGCRRCRRICASPRRSRASLRALRRAHRGMTRPRPRLVRSRRSIFCTCPCTAARRPSVRSSPPRRPRTTPAASRGQPSAAHRPSRRCSRARVSPSPRVQSVRCPRARRPRRRRRPSGGRTRRPMRRPATRWPRAMRRPTSSRRSRPSTSCGAVRGARCTSLARLLTSGAARFRCASCGPTRPSCVRSTSRPARTGSSLWWTTGGASRTSSTPRRTARGRS